VIAGETARPNELLASST